MNPIAARMAFGWGFTVGIIALIDVVILPALGLFPWFTFGAVLLFGGALAVVLGVMYAIASMLGYTQAAAGGTGGRQSRQSKGARER